MDTKASPVSGNDSNLAVGPKVIADERAPRCPQTGSIAGRATSIPATTLEAIAHGIRLGDRQLRTRNASRKGHVILEVDGADGVLLDLTVQQFRLFIALIHGRLRAANVPGALPQVSLSRLLQAAGVLDERILLSALDPRTREADLPSALRGPLTQLRQRLKPQGMYVFPIGVGVGRAAAYQLLFREEFRFADDTPEPCEIDDDAVLALRYVG